MKRPDNKKRPVLEGQTGQGNDKRGACFSNYTNTLGDVKQVVCDDPLGNTSNNVSALSKWQLLRMVQEMLCATNYQVINCQKAIGQVQVLKSDQAYFAGVMSCKSVWLCPVCNRRIAFDRGEMIRKATQSGYKMALITATLQHGKTDQLSDLLDALKLALRKLKQGRWWKLFRERWGLAAYVSSYEITYGQKNGWHPHAHILVFLDDEIDIDQFWSELASRYVDVVKKSGKYASEYHALDAKKAGGSEVANYMTKWAGSDVANEMTGYQNKTGGLKFWDLVAAGEFRLVREYASATHGLKSITWSHGGKDLLGVNDPVEDSNPVEVEIIADVPLSVWNVIRSRALQGYVLELATVDPDGLRSYIRQVEIENASQEGL